MTSSNGDPPDSDEEVGAKVIDITHRLPPLIFGDNPTGELATKVFKLLMEEGGAAPHVWFASLMVTSYAYQRLLTSVYGVEPEKMRAIFEKAREAADSMEITMKPKTGPKGV